MNSGVHGGGSGSLFPFLVEGQQRHVRRLHDLLLNPPLQKNCTLNNNPQSPIQNLVRNPWRTSSKTLLPHSTLNHHNPVKNLRTNFVTTPCLRECSGIYGPPSTGRGSLEQTLLPALIGQAPMDSPFLGGVSAPSGKPHPLFHAGSYLSSNSINVAKVIVKELQRLWEPRNRNREILPWYIRVREGSWLVVDRDGLRGHADGMVVRWLVRCNNLTKRNRNARL